MESQSEKLITIKLVHTLIWAFMVAVIFYVLYCGVYNRVNVLTWISVGIIVAEGVVLAIFGMSCPLTVLARKYSDSQRDNFDIYLPNWLAKHNKLIFTSIFVAGLITVIFRVL